MTMTSDQCSICLDSPPYSECPGRQCCALIIDNKTGHMTADDKRSAESLDFDAAIGEKP